MADLMAPDSISFTPVSSALAKVRLATCAVVLAALAAGIAVAALASDEAGLWRWEAAPVCLLAWLCWLVPRQVRAIGFAEGPDEFIIRRGVMFRSMTMVPYGRIQYVDIAQGPVARFFGIAQIKLSTASLTDNPSCLRESINFWSSIAWLSATNSWNSDTVSGCRGPSVAHWLVESTRDISAFAHSRRVNQSP